MATETSHPGPVPGLPQVLSAILDGIHGDGATAAEIAAVIRQDPGMAAEVLAAGHSAAPLLPPRCHSLETAVAALGTEAVRTLALGVSSRQFFEPVPTALHGVLIDAWQRAVSAAHLAHVLATLTRYRDPEHARLCGLLLGVGPLALLGRAQPDYVAVLRSGLEAAALLDAQRRLFGTDQVELGTRAAEAWCPEGFAADALRYQLAPLEQVADAHHLVKILNLARRLSGSAEGDASSLRAAETLFGLEEELTRALLQRVRADVARSAASLGVPAPESESELPMRAAVRDLGRSVDRLGRLRQVRAELLAARTAAGLRAAVAQGVRQLLGLEHSLLFRADVTGSRLSAWLEGDAQPAFVLALAPDRSLVADALLAGEPRVGEGSAVVDRQLRGLLHADRLWCLPLVRGEARLGVLVIGLGTEDPRVLREGDAAANLLVDAVSAEIADRVGAGVAEPEWGAEPDPDATAVGRLRFELTTPLSVINNYVETLRRRVGDDTASWFDLARIEEETGRIAQILVHAVSAVGEGPDAGFALNAAVKDVAGALERGLFLPAGVALTLDLDPRDPRLPGSPERVQALLRQLLRHAGQSLAAGSEVRVSTRARVSVNGRDHVQLIVADNGPGLPDELLESLNAPTVGGEKVPAAETGFRDVRYLTEELRGTLVFSSNGSGTRFQLLFPSQPPDQGATAERGTA